MIRVGHLELFVRDPLASLPFYRDALGATVTTVQAGRFVWLDLGGVEILLRPASVTLPNGPRYEAGRCGLVLYTDDLPATVAHLQQHGTALTCDGDDCYTFADPDGHWFQLVDPTAHQAPESASAAS